MHTILVCLKSYVEQVLEAHMNEIKVDMRSIDVAEIILMGDGNTAHGIKTSTNPAARWNVRCYYATRLGLKFS